MSDLGYATEIIPMAHDEYGGCTIRKRVYLVCLHGEALGITDETASIILKSIVEKARALKLPATNFRDYLLPDDHPYVQHMKQSQSVVPADTQT